MRIVNRPSCKLNYKLSLLWSQQFANWQLSTRSIVNLVRAQIYHTKRPPYCLQHVRRGAAHRASLSVTGNIYDRPM